MPNPLTAVISSPTATAKPDAAPPKTGEAASFQSVMDQETNPDSGEAELTYLLVQAPDEAAELEGSTAEVEGTELPVPVEGQQPDKARPAVDVLPPESDSVTPPEAASSSPQVAETAIKQPQPDAPNPETAPQTEHPAQQLVSSAFTALMLGAERQSRKPETAIPPKMHPVTPQPMGGGPQDMTRTSFTAALPEAPVQTPIAPKAQAPKGPERATSFAQIQLLASDPVTVQADTTQGAEVDDIQPAREAPTLAATRDTAPGIQAMTATARAETARAIANQMATAVNVRSQPGAIEVALNPEELGRVSIVLNGRDDGLHLTISAERPETLDMMRRHLSVLEAEFKNFGLGDLSFDLGTSADTQQDASDSGEEAEFTAVQAEPLTDTAPTYPRIGPDGRIDMRL